MNYNKTLLHVKEELEELASPGLREYVLTVLALSNTLVFCIMLLLDVDCYHIRGCKAVRQPLFKKNQYPRVIQNEHVI